MILLYCTACSPLSKPNWTPPDPYEAPPDCQVMLLQPALQQALQRASSERNFNVELITLLLEHGCVCSACSIERIFDSAAEDPFLLLAGMRRRRAFRHERRQRRMNELGARLHRRSGYGGGMARRLPAHHGAACHVAGASGICPR